MTTSATQDLRRVLKLTPLTPAVGVEVSGIDLREAQPPEVVAELQDALHNHLVLFLRDQDITPEQHVRFCEYFAPVQIPLILQEKDPNDKTPPLPPAIQILDQGVNKLMYTDTWHTDHTFTFETPMATSLRSIVIPQVGGDTCFASMYAAYDALSPAMKSFLDGLEAVHTSEQQRKHTIKVTLPTVMPKAVHPVIAVHPVTGRKVIFVNVNYTERILGLEPAESDQILRMLYDHVKQPQFQCRFRWTPHAIAIWDNRALQHCAVADYTERRLMHRCLVTGGKLDPRSRDISLDGV